MYSLCIFTFFHKYEWTKHVEHFMLKKCHHSYICTYMLHFIWDFKLTDSSFTIDCKISVLSVTFNFPKQILTMIIFIENIEKSLLQNTFKIAFLFCFKFIIISLTCLIFVFNLLHLSAWIVGMMILTVILASYAIRYFF